MADSHRQARDRVSNATGPPSGVATPVCPKCAEHEDSPRHSSDGRSGAELNEELTLARCISHAPVTATAAPAIATDATCSPRSFTPSSSATGAIRKLVADARDSPFVPPLPKGEGDRG